jgi:hypothetical protein
MTLDPHLHEDVRECLLSATHYSQSSYRPSSRSSERRLRLFPHDLDPLLGNLSPESTIAAFSAINAVPKNEKEVTSSSFGAYRRYD